jgi:hypothetical protein
MFGEKRSLEQVLGPIAERRRIDLYLPRGESSDPLIFQMAKAANEDGRPLVVCYFADADCYGYEMAATLGRKLQAYQITHFPELRWEVRPVALLPEQVKNLDLPTDPMPETSSRVERWQREFGIGQTEIDALATLDPDLLTEIAEAAIAPFIDPGLEDRVNGARWEWLREAQSVLDNMLGEVERADFREEAEAKLEELQELVEQINEALNVEIPEEVREQLPPIPEVPEPEVEGPDDEPLISSEWSWDVQTEALIAHKSYGREDE